LGLDIIEIGIRIQPFHPGFHNPEMMTWMINPKSEQGIQNRDEQP
jgi:hypothetical protein